MKTKQKLKFHILIDMDDTAFNLSTPWEQWINENGDPDFKFSNAKSWQTNEYTTIGKKCFDFLAVEGVFLDLKPLPNSVEIITKFHKLGHTVQFCTSDPQNSLTKVGQNMTIAQLEKIECLKRHFKWFDSDKHIIFSHDKGNEKGDILIDDRAKWLFEFPGVGICMDAPYNKDYEGYRVNNWIDIDKLITRLSLYMDPKRIA